MHFPISTRFVPFDVRYPPEWIFDPEAENARIELDPVPLAETWTAMEELVTSGLAKSIGKIYCIIPCLSAFIDTASTIC